LKLFSFRYSTVVIPALLLIVAGLPFADFGGAPRLCTHLLMAAWLVSIVTRPHDRVTVMLDWRSIAFIGMVSYGMYLYHLWCLHVVRIVIERMDVSQFAFQFPLTLATTVVVAATSFYWLEQPFLNLRRRFRTHETRAPA
jgi:peptidoglycan/LPS O-acetylase OafA/YrhL